MAANWGRVAAALLVAALTGLAYMATTARGAAAFAQGRSIVTRSAGIESGAAARHSTATGSSWQGTAGQCDTVLEGRDSYGHNDSRAAHSRDRPTL
jgi:hypothetical protein